MKKELNNLQNYNLAYYYQDNLYRLIAKKLNLSYSYYQILYLLRSSTCLPYGQKIVEATGEPKQTINSSLKKLEKDGIITLTKEDNSKNKRIVLTKKGEDYCKDTVDKIINAELIAFENINQNEIDNYLKTNWKLTKILQEEFEKIDG